MAWKAFWTRTLATSVLGGVLLYLAILMIDPYDSIRFSPPLERVPIAANQRFSYPALARSDAFDSVIMGTSTTRLLRPVKLNELIGGHFANLSMNSATAYEQAQLFQLFARHHRTPRTAIVGIDAIWCSVGETFEKFTPRPFPPWLYDENPWNDLLHVFNTPTLEQAGRLAAYLLGLREARFGKDGYANFLPPQSDYDLEKARRSLYGESAPRLRSAQVPGFEATAQERRSWTYPTHSLLREMLSALPAETLKVLVVVPYHHFSQPAPGSRQFAEWRECKTRLTRMADEFENGHVVDFMIPSTITLRDENYWDPLHFGRETADRFSELIAHAVHARCGLDGEMDYLQVTASGALTTRACPGPNARGQ